MRVSRLIGMAGFMGALHFSVLVNEPRHTSEEPLLFALDWLPHFGGAVGSALVRLFQPDLKDSAKPRISIAEL